MQELEIQEFEKFKHEAIHWEDGYYFSFNPLLEYWYTNEKEKSPLLITRKTYIKVTHTEIEEIAQWMSNKRNKV